jgi:phage gp29-like protein
VAWLYLFKNFDLKAWVEFLEVFGQPIRLGKYGQGASADEKATLLRAVRSLAKDAAAIIPQSMQVDLIEAKVSGNVTVQQAFADWVDRQVSKAVLGQTGTTDTGQYVGTANAHDKVKDDIERDDARQVANTINDCLVRPVIDLNLGPQARYPRLVIARPDAVDTKLFMETVKTFVELGGDVEQSVVRDRLGLPDPPPGKTVKLLRPAGAGGAAPVSEPPTTQTPPVIPTLATAAQTAPGHSTPDPDAIDTLISEMLGEWHPVMDPLVNPVQDLLAECTSLEEFQRRLPELVQRQDPKGLADLLAKALFAARLSGETADG